RQLGKLSCSSRWMWLQTHLIAPPFQSPPQLCWQLLLTSVLQVSRSLFLRGFSRLHQMLREHQKTVPDCHRRSVAPAPFPEASRLRPQVRSGPCWCRCRLHQGGPHGTLPWAGSPPAPVSRAFIVSGTPARPRSQVRRRGGGVPVDAYLCKEHPEHAPPAPANHF